MIDFFKKIKNSNKFRSPALMYIDVGYYCSYPKGTAEYYDYWRKEMDYCINGYTAEDGDFITGYHYFYLNYCPITRIEYKTDPKTGKTKRLPDAKTFPDFYDYDYFYFLAIEEAEELGKHMCVAKSRRKGYSYKGGSMLCRNFFLIPNSKSYVYASNKQFLTDDGILTKAWDYMDFIDQNTAWAKKRSVNTQMRRRASFRVTDDYGNETEVGYKSEIIGLSLKDNPDVVRGKRGKLILFEEAGTFSELKAAWQIARPSVEHDGEAFGLMIMFGTGGDQGNAIAALREAFYDPKQYNCLSFPNIWDDSAESKECGFFVPYHTNLDTRDKEGNRLYMDADGNTMHKKSKIHVLNQRESEMANAKDSQTIDRYTAERSETPMEAFMELTGNIFPKKQLQQHLAFIRTNKKVQHKKQIGDLLWIDSKLSWEIKPHGDIKSYPLEKNADPTGAMVIWEHPVDDIPVGLYIAGCDPYDHDQSGTNSLGSCFIYKRIQHFESYHDVIVAEYTGRPKTAEEYYENVRKLLLYYNARLMYENQNKGLFMYFSHKHSDYLLADQPDILKDIVQSSRVIRGKGSHVTKEIKMWGEGKIKEWLEEEVSAGVPRLTTILSEPLIEELIQYNTKGNFDRVMAFMQVMVYREQLYHVQVKKRDSIEKRQRLFDLPIYTEQFYDQESNTNNLNQDIFTNMPNNETLIPTYTYGAYYS